MGNKDLSVVGQKGRNQEGLRFKLEDATFWRRKINGLDIP
jgi:hypothetical protein